MAIGALIPAHLWVIKETIVANGHERLHQIFFRGYRWFAVCLGLASLTFTQWFVPTQIGDQIPRFREGYYVHMAGLVIVYAVLCRQSVQQMRSQVGASRLELQIVLLGGSVAALTVILLMGLRELFAISWITALQPLVVLCFFAGTAVAITTTRILDAQQIVYVGLQKSSLIAIVTFVAYVSYHVLILVLPESFAFVGTTAITLWMASVANAWLDRLFRFYPQGVAARQAAFTVAQRETRIENLERAFRVVLNGWGQSEHSIILSGSRELLSGDGIDLGGQSAVVRTLYQLRWVTPERLNRERRTPERSTVAEFLAQHKLGVLVIEDGPALAVIIGVGVAASRRPFTYPQVTQLMELASIMESALERAHFSAKVQHTEQLATVGLLGASLAHEIRNPLVSIKTFVQLLPTHYHDLAFREKFFRLIGDEVGRIDQLTEQLLDLASPRAYAAEMIALHPVLRASLDLVAAKATHKNIQFLTEFQAVPDQAFTDASAAKQVIINLCFNAIQAVDASAPDERWVKIATRNTKNGIEMAVADSGPGIAAEIRARLFQPFQTTKSTGFGLGLAICSDILANLSASITVDPPEIEWSALAFRVFSVAGGKSGHL